MIQDFGPLNAGYVPTA